MSEKELLNIKDLVVDVEEKEILHGVNLTIRPGETHVLMGPNGTGKSTLGYTLLGNPRYTVTQGDIWFAGKRIRLWEFKKQLEAAMELLDMDKSYAERDLNVGFSGGEKKKAEILQLLMLKPKLAILDETDSGLDVDAVRTVSAGIREYQKNSEGSLLVITHSTKILESLPVDYTHVMVEGKIIKTGGAGLVDEINESGFAGYEAEEHR